MQPRIIGIPEGVVLLAIFLMSLVVVWPVGRICRRLGFSRWLGILAVVPVANLPALVRGTVGMAPAGRVQLMYCAFYAAGRKYNTIPAPTDASTKPTYSIGCGATFGGCIAIESSTLTIGAPPKTRGMT